MGSLAGDLAFGFAIGVYGTLVGAGGGFLLVPFLLLVRHFAPAEAAGTSLAVVFVNAFSGSLAYARQRRIDYASGLWFAAAALPGALVGAYAARLLPAVVFHRVFAVLLVASSAFLLWKPEALTVDPSAPEARPRRAIFPVERRVVDATGEVFVYRYDRLVGIVISVVVGFLSSALGIGGGIVHVPVLHYLLSFPAHLSTATSHFVLAITAGVGMLAHLALGHVRVGPALALGAGAALGAPLGARLSGRLHGRWILRGLALALLFVGVRLLLS